MSRYSEARAAGLCGACQHRPAAVGPLCAECKKKRDEGLALLLKQGLCPRCKGRLADGKTECPSCLERSRKRSADRTARLKAGGKCIRCGKDGGYRLCDVCRLDKNETDRRRRLVLKTRGICTTCGKRQALPEKTLCPECLESKADRYVISRGDPEVIAASKKRSLAHRAKRIANGQCYRCGSPKLYRKLKTCKACTEKHRIRNRIRKSTKKMDKRAEKFWARKDRFKKTTTDESAA